MKTIEIKLYKFEELSEEAKQNAIKKYRSTGGVDTQYIYDEAHNTVKEFEEIFPTDSRGNNGWLDCNIRVEENIAALTGERLRKYILNSYGHILFKGKYYGKLVYTFPNGEKIPVSKEHPIGARHVKRYSKVFFDNSCVLTGVCYDHSMLQPIYDFLDRKNNLNMNFEELLEECYKSLKKDIENEEEAMNGDDYIAENIEANEYEFTEDGKMYK